MFLTHSALSVSSIFLTNCWLYMCYRWQSLCVEQSEPRSGEKGSKYATRYGTSSIISSAAPACVSTIGQWHRCRLSALESDSIIALIVVIVSVIALVIVVFVTATVTSNAAATSDVFITCITTTAIATTIRRRFAGSGSRNK